MLPRCFPNEKLTGRKDDPAVAEATAEHRGPDLHSSLSIKFYLVFHILTVLYC